MHCSYRVISAFVFCISSITQAWAQDVRPVSPDELVRLGLENNALMDAARGEAAEARAAYRQARSQRLPSLSSQASYTRLSSNIPELDFEVPGFDTEFTLAPVELNRYYSELSVEQPLFTGFRLQNQIRAAAHLANAAAFEAEQQRIDLALEIRRAYWRLYGAEAALDAVAASLGQMNAHLQDVRNRREVGAALESHVLSARTRRSEVLFDRVEAENEVRVAQLELNRLAGLPLNTQLTPIVEIAVEPMLDDLEVLVAQAAEAQPTLNALREQVDALEDRVNATRGSLLPEVVMSGRYVYARPNQYFFVEQDQFNGTWEAGLALRWRIWDGGARSAETARARARLQSASARLEYAVEGVAVDATRRFLEIQRAVEAVEVAAQITNEADESFRMISRQFDEGVALSADVLDAEQALRSARARHAQALAEYGLSRASLLHVLGKIW
jgi:outer membrane protein TolC